MADGKAQVFISYSWKDKESAKRIEDILRHSLGERFHVWRDENVMKPSDHFSSKILEGLNGSDYFVLLVSENSNASLWVKREIATAVELADKKKLTAVPVLLSDVEVPFEFRGLLYIDARNGGHGLITDQSLDRIVRFFGTELQTISTLDPREKIRKTEDDSTRLWRACQEKLRTLERRQLRFHLTQKLSINEVKVIWYDIFGRKLEDEVSVQTLALCCVELLERSYREELIVELIDIICQNYPRVAASLR